MVAHSSNPSPRGSSAPPADPPGPVLKLPDAAAARIIRELAEPSASLDSVAAANRIAVADLALWLTTPEARERMLAIEQGGYAHVRMAASLKLSHAVGALIRVLDTFNALAASRPANDPLVIRAAIHANKAAYHLYRLSRIMPIDETQGARAHDGIRAARAIANQVTSQITSQVTNPVATQAQAAPPLQSAPRVSQTHPAPASTPVPDACSAVENHTPVPQTPAAHAPASLPAADAPSHNATIADEIPTDMGPNMDQILSQLTALATSLGIDISDLDDPGPYLGHESGQDPCTSPLTLADTT